MKKLLLFLIVTSAVFAQRPLMFKPCTMCYILDDDSSAKVLSYFADYNGVEYAFDTDAHRIEFLSNPEVWLTWSNEPEPDGIATLIPS